MAEEKKVDGIDDYLFIKYILLLSTKWVVAVVTRYYPFSELFKDCPYNAYWFGADKMRSYISLCAIAYGNNFVDYRFDRDEDYYYVSGRLEHETEEDIFVKFEETGKNNGLNFWFRGKLDDGSYKFMAPVNQKWLNVFF